MCGGGGGGDAILKRKTCMGLRAACVGGGGCHIKEEDLHGSTGCMCWGGGAILKRKTCMGLRAACVWGGGMPY